MWSLLLFALAQAGVPEDTAAVVSLFRDGIVLASAVDTLPEGQRRDVPAVGELLFFERLERTTALEEALLADIPADKADKAKLITAFLDAVEAPAMHPGDRLPFADTLDHLTAALEAAPAGKRRDALLVRAEHDAALTHETEAHYREEMRAVFGKLGLRGEAVSREAWDAYVAAIVGERSVDAVFARYASDVSAISGATRGLRDNDAELYGTSLPDKTFVLTFDDGPSATYTPEILKILEERGVKAVFFQVGRNVGAVDGEGHATLTDAGPLTAQILAGGHLLGNHSWSHKNLPRQTDEQLATQIDQADAVLDAASGSDVTLFRPPYGGRDERVLTALTDRGTRAYLWNVDSMDWADPIPESIAQTVLDQARARDHGVILFHDVHAQTVAALPLVLDALQAEGYELVLWDGTSILGERGSGPSAPAPTRDSLYADSWAVVIGIDQYAAWPRLAHARYDAEGMADALVERFGFAEDHVIRLLDGDATRERILAVLGDELPGKVGEDDRVLVFYAGHGATRALPGGGQRGYLVPVDADTTRLQSTAISMSELEDVQSALPARHVLFVMDACYSGIALTRAGATTAGDPRRYLMEVTRRTARQILTAGGADEQVTDHGPSGHSIFTFTVLQGLEGPADLNGDGFLTASELSSYVAPRVSALSKQTPAYGSLSGSAGGEFVFTLEPDQALLSGLSASRVDDAELSRARSLLAEKEAETEALRAELERLRGASPGEDPATKARLLHAYGLEQYREGHLADAYAALSQAATLAPDDVEIVNNLGFLLQEMGELEASLPWLVRATELDASRPVAWLNLGDSYEGLGRRPDAVAAYRTYLTLAPDSPARRRIDAVLADVP